MHGRTVVELRLVAGNIFVRCKAGCAVGVSRAQDSVVSGQEHMGFFKPERVDGGREDNSGFFGYFDRSDTVEGFIAHYVGQIMVKYLWPP